MGDVKQDSIDVTKLIEQASEYENKTNIESEKLTDLFDLCDMKRTYSIDSFDSTKNYSLEQINDQLENMNIAIDHLTDLIEIKFEKLNRKMNKLLAQNDQMEF